MENKNCTTKVVLIMLTLLTIVNVCLSVFTMNYIVTITNNLEYNSKTEEFYTDLENTVRSLDIDHDANTLLLKIIDLKKSLNELESCSDTEASWKKDLIKASLNNLETSLMQLNVDYRAITGENCIAYKIVFDKCE